MGFVSNTRPALMFVVHQVIVLWVVAVSAPILTASSINFLRLFGWQDARGAYDWILKANPYFPAHIALALLLGWMLGRSLLDRSMLWVWVFPTLLLGYALIAIPTLIPRIVPSAFQAGIGQSRLAHYFGWGCQYGDYCLDQSSFTRPFYASIAYSLTSLIAIKTWSRARRGASIQFLMLLVVGTLFLIAAVCDLVQSVRIGGWRWAYLPLEGTVAGMGMYLMLLAFGTQEKNQSSAVSH